MGRRRSARPKARYCGRQLVDRGPRRLPHRPPGDPREGVGEEQPCTARRKEHEARCNNSSPSRPRRDPPRLRPGNSPVVPRRTVYSAAPMRAMLPPMNFSLTRRAAGVRPCRRSCRPWRCSAPKRSVTPQRRAARRGYVHLRRHRLQFRCLDSARGDEERQVAHRPRKRGRAMARELHAEVLHVQIGRQLRRTAHRKIERRGRKAAFERRCGIRNRNPLQRIGSTP